MGIASQQESNIITMCAGFTIIIIINKQQCSTRGHWASQYGKQSLFFIYRVCETETTIEDNAAYEESVFVSISNSVFVLALFALICGSLGIVPCLHL